MNTVPAASGSNLFAQYISRSGADLPATSWKYMIYRVSVRLGLEQKGSGKLQVTLAVDVAPGGTVYYFNA
jgi:hypothetical protein